MAIVYAIESLGGVRGTLADAYGVYANPMVSAFVANVAIQQPQEDSAAPTSLGRTRRRRG